MVNEGKVGSAEERVNIGAWVLIAILDLFVILSYINRSILSLLVEPIKKSLELSDFQMGLLLGPAFAVTYSICGFPLGWCADNLSRRLILFGGVVVWGLATAASGVSGSFDALLIARMLVGVGEAALTPVALTMIAGRFPRSKLALAMALYHIGPRIGPSVAYWVGAYVIAASGNQKGHGTDWHSPFLVIGLATVVLAFLTFAIRDPGSRASKARQEGPPEDNVFQFLSKNAWLMTLFLVGFSASGVALAIYLAWIPAFIQRHFGWGPVQYAPLLGGIGILSALALIVKGLIVDQLFKTGMRDAHIRFYTWLLFASLPIPLFVFNLRDPFTFLGVLALFEMTALSNLLFGSAAIALIVPARLRGQLSALYMGIATLVGQGLGPVIVGFLTTDVFKTKDSLGLALTISLEASLVIAFVSLRLLLRPIGEAIRVGEAPSLQGASIRGG